MIGILKKRAKEPAADDLQLAHGLDFDDLFDPAFLARLEQFLVRVSRAQKGGRLAEQRTSARGQGTDFADYKPYVPGDDLRTVDWNSYQRLGRLFVRVFEEWQDLPVYLLVDRSRSMFVEEPPRIRAALRCALALSAVAMRQQDSVSLLPFSETIEQHRLQRLSGRAGTVRMAQALSEIEPAGGTRLAAAVRQFAEQRRRRGLLVVISDFFDDEGVEAAVAAMQTLPHSLLLVRLVKDHDADPARALGPAGDVMLRDAESEEGTQISVTDDLLKAYQRNYRAFERTLENFARGSRAVLVPIDADRDVIDQLGDLFATQKLAL